MRVDSNWKKIWFGAMKYRPNPTQAPIVDEFIDGGRFLLISGGERSGKSYTGAATAGLDMGPRLDDSGEVDKTTRLYWIVADGYRSCRPEFTYIYEALKRIGGVVDVSMPKDDNSPWSLETPWGVRIETRTSSDTAKLSSFTVHGAIMAEANAQEEEAFRKLRGRISETRGWLLLVGTLEESTPWYVDLMMSWRGENNLGGKSYSLPTWSNTDVYPLGANDPEILLLKNTLPEDYFAFRYAAEPMKSSKLVIPEFDRGIHVRSLSVDPDLPVELAIDPGTHSFAIGFCQVSGDRTNVLSAMYEKNAIVQDLIPKIRSHPLWKYVIPNQAGVIDVAGKQRHANKSVVQIFMEDGIILRSRKHFLKASINALRNRLRVSPVTGVPNIYFDTSIRSGYTVSGRKVIATGPLTEFDLWKNNDLGEPDKLNCDFTKALSYFILDHFGQDTLGGKKKARYGARTRKGWVKR